MCFKLITCVLLSGLCLLPMQSDAARLSEENTSDGRKVLIVGAGVAGLTLAHQLKARGLEPTLVERSPVLRTGGYKIDIRGAALHVVKQMGVYDALCAVRTDYDEVRILNHEGDEVGLVDIDISGARVEEDIELMRGDLCQILMNQLAGIETLYGNSPTRIAQLSDGVEVEFEQGKSRKFDFVIGADGIHSAVRELVFGEEALFLEKLGVNVSVYSIENYQNAKEYEVEYFEPGRYVNVYSSFDRGRTIACFGFCSEALDYDRHDLEVQKDLLRTAYQQAGADIQDLLTHVQDAKDFYFDSVGQVHMPRWSKGRVALVGDAAYAPSPLSGQGTSAALIGAYVLAEELAASDDVSSAFERYETRLRTYVKKNQELVEFSLVAIGARPDSWMSSFFQFLFMKTPTEALELLKEFGTYRVHQAAVSIQLSSTDE